MTDDKKKATPKDLGEQAASNMTNDENEATLKDLGEQAASMYFKLKALDEKYIELFGRVYKYRAMLSNDGLDEMQKNILEQYRLAYRIFSLQGGIKIKSDIYRLEARESEQVPKKWRFLLFWHHRNRAAELVDRDEGQKADAIHDEFEAALDALDEQFSAEFLARLEADGVKPRKAKKLLKKEMKLKKR